MSEGACRSFRVLALDGGGIKGTFTAAVLATLEEMNPGLRVAQHFDLICGTSTGGIIALALGMGLSASDILRFYTSYGPCIFPVTGPLGRAGRKFVQGLIGPKLDAEPLREALTQVFEARTLGQSASRLVIPTYDAVRGDIKLFKTAHSRHLKQDFRALAVEVALATSAAPTYFAPATTGRGDIHVDGGIWANSPVVIGVHEAMIVLGQPLESVRVLSIGTTDEPFSMSKKRGMAGALRRKGWLDLGGQANIELILNAQQAGALAQARLLLGSHLLRVSRTVEPGRFSLDDAGGIEALRNLGDSEARHREREIQDRFFAPGPVTPFTPIWSDAHPPERNS